MTLMLNTLPQIRKPANSPFVAFAKGTKERTELEKEIEKIVIKETEEEARNFISVGTLPPANFPAWLIHDSDYYGEGLAPKLQLDTTFGWNGEV